MSYNWYVKPHTYRVTMCYGPDYFILWKWFPKFMICLTLRKRGKYAFILWVVHAIESGSRYKNDLLIGSTLVTSIEPKNGHTPNGQPYVLYWQITLNTVDGVTMFTRCWIQFETNCVDTNFCCCIIAQIYIYDGIVLTT